MSSPPLQSVDLSAKGSDFKATPEELKTIQERMKDPVFMELLHDYMKTLEDPETRREEEAYLEQAEREAREGGDFSFEFIFPRPQFVVELQKPTTTILTTEDRRKMGLARDTPQNKQRCQGVRTFINVCASEKVEEYREETTGDRMGSHWHVPVSVSQKRVEYLRPQPPRQNAHTPSTTSTSATGDASRAEGEDVCYVHDAVFHPRTLALVERSNRFLCFLVEIAVEHINAGYGQSHGFEFTRLPSDVTSIGQPQNQTVRTGGGARSSASSSPFTARPDLPVLTHPQTPDGLARTQAAAPTPAASAPPPHEQGTGKRTGDGAPTTPAEGERLPPHSIAHRGQLDLTDAWQWKIVDRRVGVPQELVVKITFTGVQRAAGLDVDITEDGSAILVRKTPQQTQFEGLIVLPFTVQTTPVSAKFERQSSVLTLVLAVVPPPITEDAEALRQEVVKRAIASPLRPSDETVSVADPEKQADSPPPPPPPAQSTAPVEVHDKPTTEVPLVAAPVAVTTGATAPTQAEAAPLPSAVPVTEHIQDSARAQAMLAKVQEARRAREAATQDKVTAAVAAPPEREAGAAPAVDDMTSPSTAADTTHAVSAVTHPPEPALTAEDELPFIRKRDAAQEAQEAEEAALLARQEAWRQMVKEQLDAVAQAESEEVARAEAAAAREAAKTKKKAELARQQEALELELQAKMRSLPLNNKHILSID